MKGNLVFLLSNCESQRVWQKIWKITLKINIVYLRTLIVIDKFLDWSSKSS